MSRENTLYTRATGKLSTPSSRIYVDSRSKERDSSTIYTVEDAPESNEQYPLGCLTPNQKILISQFLSGICKISDPQIDKYRRAIHFVGEWKDAESDISVVCTLVQPHITNSILHLKGIAPGVVLSAKNDYVAVVGGDIPKVTTISSPQPQGTYAIPFTDYMIQRGCISESNVSWSNVVFSNTQPIFIVITKDSAYECGLTHTCCSIMSRDPPEDAVISPPNTRSESYSFRRLSITDGRGSGPSVTVHRSGTIQYQGGSKYIKSITLNFRNCIDKVLQSKNAGKFISSLSIVRDVSCFMPSTISDD